MALTLDALHDAVAGGTAGVRARFELEPLGGPGDKIAPPTYSGDAAPTKYAEETRRIGGVEVRCVSLNSVAAQANTMEETLLEAVRAGRLALPLVSVDFREVEGLADLDRISSLQAPHRVFDAILRDSLLDDRLFRMSSVGRAVTEASVRNAEALYRYSPATLVFGGWDSTGPRGGRGAKYERALTSEIVGIGAMPGTRAASRIDPLGIELAGNTLYETDDGSWTLSEDDAKREKGKAVLYTGSGDGAPGRPSQVNHGNVTPSLDARAGGVTVDRVEAITVLSFIQLRRLGFPLGSDGEQLGERRRGAEQAARTALAALALTAVTLSFEQGFDLRSRCVLVPTADLEFELVQRGSGGSSRFSLTGDEALALTVQAVEAAASYGLVWHTDEILLRPADRLVQLVRNSRPAGNGGA